MHARRRYAATGTLTLLVVALTTGCSAFGPIVPSDAPVRDSEGRIIAANEQTDAFSLQVGDCLNDAAAEGSVTTIPTVPCDEPHDSEVYAAVELGPSAYPGDDIIRGTAQSVCLPSFEEFVGEPYLESRFDFAFYHPTEASWSSGDREILCVIYDPEGPVTGSLRGVTD